jgi:hypothetical protein
MLLCTIDQLYMETILRHPRARKEKGEEVVEGEKSDMNNYWQMTTKKSHTMSVFVWCQQLKLL